MERRVVIAVALAIGVLFLTPKLFPPPPRPIATVPNVPDSAPLKPEVAQDPPTQVTAPVEAPAPAESSSVPVEATVVAGSKVTFAFSNLGAVLEHAQLPGFKALGRDTGSVSLYSRLDPLLAYSIVSPNDTVSLKRVAFAVTYDTVARTLDYRAKIDRWVVEMRYAVNPDGYMLRVSGQVTDIAGNAPGDSVFLIVNLPRSLESYEANPVEDWRAAAVAVKPTARGASQTGLASLDPNEQKMQPGPLTWAALKSKYFILGVIAADTTAPITEVQVRGLVREQRDVPSAQITLVQRLRTGQFAFDIYAGPQEWDTMRAIGRDFGAANSYGGFLQPVVQPFATIVMRVLLWMHRALNLHYGWVLLLFGVVVRVAMWPLNQTAMKSSMRMQELQPLLSEVQKRYKSDPQRMSAETMRLYKEHGMSPFSPLAGCFPILLSMPVLFALFFVFQSTIEFRGVPFAWLHDLSVKDPLYIAPLLMGGSMFLTSWLSMRSLPPNPQTRIMTYVLPVMMTVLLASMASGLNLYWAAQNVASLPQQWLISRERAKRKAVKPA